MKNFVSKGVYDILSHYNIFIPNQLQLRFCAKFSDAGPGIHAAFCGLSGKYFPCTVLLLYLNRLLKRAPQSPDVTREAYQGGAAGKNELMDMSGAFQAP